MNVIPTPEIRAKYLAEARASFEKEITEPGAWDAFVAEWRETLRKDPAESRGEFMLHMMLKGVNPNWADAMATEFGVVEYSDKAVAKAAEIIAARPTKE